MQQWALLVIILAQTARAVQGRSNGPAPQAAGDERAPLRPSPE